MKIRFNLLWLWLSGFLLVSNAYIGAMYVTVKIEINNAKITVEMETEAEARKNNWNMAIAILDAGSHLLMFQRMDDVQIGSIDIAIGKAKTAVNFKRPTKALDDLVSGGRNAFLAIEGVIPLQGGLPVMIDGKLIGGVGVSGGTAPQDEQVSQAAVSVLQG